MRFERQGSFPQKHLYVFIPPLLQLLLQLRHFLKKEKNLVYLGKKLMQGSRKPPSLLPHVFFWEKEKNGGWRKRNTIVACILSLWPGEASATKESLGS
jgi:hypothetical protein